MGYDGSLKFDTKIDESGFSSGISRLGGIAKGGLAVLGSAVVGASAAFIGLSKAALDSTASLEQNIGGIETLFKSSAQTVIDNANKAYKTAGLSANEYMQSVTSFSASLLQSVAGDTDKAAKVADMAMIDMSDNANKMGSNMQDIQNAYQGFAKQNYTMLDNLKLGYGGTKTEMERLLADAEKISGVKYDISNLKDVYSAIHVIQEELDITGTTAKEAATTIEGSMNSARAAFDNYLNGSGSVDEFVEAFSIAAQNIGKNLAEIVPRLAATIPEIVSAIAQQLATAVKGDGAAKFAKVGADAVTSLITGLTDALPTLITAGVMFIEAVIESLNTNLPQLVSSGGQILMSLIEGIVTLLPSLGELALNIILQIYQGITDNAPQMIPAAIELLLGFIQGFVSNLPKLWEAGLNMLMAVAEGIINSLPILIEQVPKIINSFFDALDSFLPKILLAGVQILIKLGEGIIQSIPVIIANAGEIIKAIFNVITHFSLFSQGKTLVKGMGDGIKSVFGNISSVAKSLIEKIKNPFNINWGSIGKNIVTGIANGLKNAAGAIANAARTAARNALNAAKSFLGIHSPSRVFRDQVGKNMALGMGVGFEKNVPTEDMTDSLSDSVNKMRQKVSIVTKSQSGTVKEQAIARGEGMPGDDTPVVLETTNIFVVDGEQLVSKTAKATIKKINRDQESKNKNKGK